MKKAALLSTVMMSVSFAGQALAEPVFDANLELDTDITDYAESKTKYSQGGRIELNAAARHTRGDYFVAAKGSLLMKKSSDASIDDAYLAFGSNRWDVKAGRFEAINLFPLGKDTLIVHAGDGSAEVYEANLVRGRAEDDAGQIALHVKASDAVSFELDTIFGDVEDGDDTTAISGLRPSVTFSNGDMSLTAGYEHYEYDQTDGGKTDIDGYALTAAFNISNAAVNVSLARKDDKENDKEVTSFGTNLTYGNLGLGYIFSETDLSSGSKPEVSTFYAAYTMPLLDIENATVTLAASFSQADHAGDDDNVNALRTRFNYTF